ncbi:hypothetical protein [Rossellomorea marisflavi]|uniref:hypothetical protein n=1 Tax=Rossellomorea marisflavi TaxID=189381 RepID=UPI000AC5444A|nr:hypothetical protein [Rossellomorea marisflavi]
MLKRFTMPGKILFTTGFILIVLRCFLFTELNGSVYWKVGLVVGVVLAIGSNFFTIKRSSKRR